MTLVKFYVGVLVLFLGLCGAVYSAIAHGEGVIKQTPVPMRAVDKVYVVEWVAPVRNHTELFTDKNEAEHFRQLLFTAKRLLDIEEDYITILPVTEKRLK